MNSITHTINGLASSLLFNVGFSQLAQKLDPVTASKHEKNQFATSSEISEIPCQFTAKKGL